MRTGRLGLLAAWALSALGGQSSENNVAPGVLPETLIRGSGEARPDPRGPWLSWLARGWHVAGILRTFPPRMKVGAEWGQEAGPKVH